MRGLDTPDNRAFIGQLANAFQAGYDPRGFAAEQRAQAELQLARDRDARAAELHNIQVKGLRAQQADADLVRGARDELLSAERDGIQTGSVRGLAAPSQKMLFQGQGGYGRGAAAVKEAAGDYGREMRRFGMPAEAAGDYDASEVGQRAAGKRDIVGLRKSLALAKGDDAGYASARADESKLNIDDRFKANVEKLAKDPKYAEELFSYVNEDGQLPFTVSEGKDGFLNLHIVKPGGKAVPVTLNRAQREQLVLGAAHIEEGDTATGLAIIGAINKDMAAALKSRFEMTLDGARTANDVTYKRGALADARARTRIAGEEADRRAAQEKWDVKNPQTQYRVGPDGRPVPYLTGVRIGPQGLTPVELAMPGGGGLIPANVFDSNRYVKAAEGMVGTDIPGSQGPDRKPLKYTLETAVDALMQREIARYTGQGAGGRIDPNIGAAMAKDLARGAPTAPAPRAAPQPSAPAPQAAPYRFPQDSLVGRLQQRADGLPPGVETSGLGFMVNGTWYMDRDAAIRAAQAR